VTEEDDWSMEEPGARTEPKQFSEESED